jgi:RNA polymerase sigma factor (sigma-70 family)
MADVQLVRVVHQLRRLAATPDVEEKSDPQLLREFARGRDQAAFTALVERHGPLVLRVCCHVLSHEQDAEDAFQAAFLVLARRAASLGRCGALAGWLHGVAYRIAMQAKRNAARRRAHEARAVAAPQGSPCRELAWREFQAVLDEEIQRLPSMYRTPFVLCVLEGQGRAEVARQLGVKEGTVWSRLAQARKRLQARLARRGIELGAVLAAGYLAAGAARASVPPRILAATLRVALADGTGAGISVQVAALARDAFRPLAAVKVKLAAALFLLAGALGAGTAALVPQPPAARPPAVKSPASADAADAHAGAEEGRHRTDRYLDPLPEAALARLGTVRFRQSYAVYITSFLADGKALLLGGHDGLALWETATGRRLRQFPSPQGANRAALSPDGKTLAVGGIGTTLWDVATGRRLKELDKEFAASVTFAADGKTLAVGTDKGVNLWDIAGGKKVCQFNHASTIRAVAFAFGGKVLASVGEDGTVRLWDVATGKESRRWDAGKGHFQSLAAAPAGAWLAHADEQVVRLLDADSGREVRLLGPKPYRAGKVAFSPDGKILACGQYDGAIYLWEVATGKQTARWRAPTPSIYALAFAPDGKVLVSAGHGGSDVRWWDVASGREIPRPQTGHRGPVKALAFSRDGRELFSLGDDGMFFRWDPAAGVDRSGCRLPLSAVAMFSPDGMRIVSSEWNPEARSATSVKFRDARTGREIRPLKVPWTNRIAFSPDGRSVALSEAGDGTVGVSVWDLDSGKRRHQFTEAGERLYFDITFSPDGKKLAAGSWNEQRPNFHLWDLDSGKKTNSCDPDHWVNSIAFSPDGDLVALGSGGDWTKCISVWSLATAKRLLTLTHPGSGSEVVVAFSPSGRFLATGASLMSGGAVETSDQNVVRVWEIVTGRQVAAFAGHHSGVTALVFAPDDRTLASGAGDSTILVWDLVGRLRNQPGAHQPPTAAWLQARWQDLDGADPVQAYEAIGELVGCSDAGVAFLKTRLSAVPPPNAAALRLAAKLAGDLDSEDFAVRQRAAQELEKLGGAAAGVLRKALSGRPTLEVRRRIGAILDVLHAREASRRVRLSRALEVLELVATAQARDLLGELATGDPEAWLTREVRATRARLDRAGKR